MKINRIICGVLLFSSLVFGAETFEYSVRGYPAVRGNCESAAVSLAETFERATGTMVLGTKVTPFATDYCDINVSYISNDPVFVVTDVTYQATLESCAKVLPTEIATYQAATGIKPTVAYCGRDSFIHSRALLRMDAFGESRLKSYSLDLRDTEFSSALVGNPNVIAGEIKGFLNAKGAIPRQVEFVTKRSPWGTRWESTLYLSYLAKTAIRLDLDADLTFHTERECERAIPDVKGIVAKKGTVVTAFCTYDATRFVFVLRLMTERSCYNPKALPTNYRNVEACESDKDRVVKAFVEKLGQEVSGALCYGGRDDYGRADGYRMMLYLGYDTL